MYSRVTHCRSGTEQCSQVAATHHRRLQHCCPACTVGMLQARSRPLTFTAHSQRFTSTSKHAGSPFLPSGRGQQERFFTATLRIGQGYKGEGTRSAPWHGQDQLHCAPLLVVSWCARLTDRNLVTLCAAVHAVHAVTCQLRVYSRAPQVRAATARCYDIVAQAKQLLTYSRCID